MQHVLQYTTNILAVLLVHFHNSIFIQHYCTSLKRDLTWVLFSVCDHILLRI